MNLNYEITSGTYVVVKIISDGTWTEEYVNITQDDIEAFEDDPRDCIVRRGIVESLSRWMAENRDENGHVIVEEVPDDTPTCIITLFACPESIWHELCDRR